MTESMISQGFWQDRKVFVVGHTGFRGSHLSQVLQGLGAVVAGFALPPKTNPNHFEIENVAAGMASTFGDIRDPAAFRYALDYFAPEIVISLLGDEGLKQSKADPREAFGVQVLGAVEILEAVRAQSSVRACVFLTSDKVYRLGADKEDSEKEYKESDSLGGQAPAATAKACVELVVESYLNSFFQPEKYNKHKVAVATARMGSVIGGGDFEANSFVWQVMQSLRLKTPMVLKNPQSVRSWLAIEDAISGILRLAQSLVENGPKASGAWNFGVPSENRLSVQTVFNYLSGEEIKTVIPTATPSVHASLNSQKAQQELGWQPKPNIQETTKKIRTWYQSRGF